MNSTGKLYYSSRNAYAHYVHYILSFLIFMHTVLLTFTHFAFFFFPSLSLIFFSLQLGILRISYTSFTIQWSWFITVTNQMWQYYRKKTSLRSVCQLPWRLPQLSGKETKMPNCKQKQHMILLSQSSQWRHWTLHSSTHCHYLLCSCLLVYVSHQNLTHLLQNIQSK